MAGIIKNCRVCGRPYEACRSAKVDDGVFRWKEVACSPECGEIYLTRVLIARGELPIAPDTKEDDKSAMDEAASPKPARRRAKKQESNQ